MRKQNRFQDIKQGNGKLIDAEKMKQYKYPSKKAQYSEIAIMLYSVSIGLGKNPLNKRHMKFVYERDDNF